MEGITCNSLRRIPCDEFDGLHYTVNDLKFWLSVHESSMSRSTNFVFNTRIFTLRVFTNEDRIHVVVESFETFDGNAGTDIGKEIKGSPKG